MSFTLNVNLGGLDDAVDAMDERLQANVRPAAQAGAQVLYDGVQRNVAALGRKTGKLAQAIYQAYSRDQSRDGLAVYHVSWNARKAPHGHLVEFGHIQKFKVYLGKDGRWYTNKHAPLPTPVQVAAKPFLRPAAALFPVAQDAMQKRLLERIE